MQAINTGCQRALERTERLENLYRKAKNNGRQEEKTEK